MESSMSRTPYKALIIDDERPARAKVARLLAGDGRFVNAGEAGDGLEALRCIAAVAPDLVVLDIQMPGISGFEVLDAMGADRNFAVMFSTAHDAHALRAFDAHAVDYLLKPYDAARFQCALDKACAQLDGGIRGTQPGVAEALVQARGGVVREHIVVRTQDGWIPLTFDSITRVTAADKHVSVFAGGDRHTVRASLAAISARLCPRRFVRVHRGELVNLNAIARFESSAHGDGVIVLADGSAVVLSRTFRRSFLQRFGQRAEYRDDD
jgi:two-component system LytT family response regulator